MTVPRERSWMWWSTQESIENDVPSVWAIVETLLAVPLYWWIAMRFETYALLLLSAAVAPLVLLRSDEAVALGLKWFSAWWRRVFSEESAYRALTPDERRVVWLAKVAAAMIGGATAYLLAIHFLSGIEGWSAFWRAALIVWVAVTVAVGAAAGAVAVAGAGAGAGAGTGAGAGAGTGAGAVGVGVGVAVAVAEAGAVAGAVAGTGAVAVAVAVAGAGAGAGGRAVLGLPVTLGFATAVYLVSLAVRIGATVRFVRPGVHALPRNFRRLALCTSPGQLPELIPGIETTGSDGLSGFTLRGRLRQFLQERHTDPLVAYAVHPIVALVWFLPGWLYRFTLKSTAWFWWPLAFLGGELHRAKDPPLFHRQTVRSLWGRTSIVLAIAALACFAVVNFVLNGAVFHGNPLLTTLGYLFIVDWAVAPWQILPLAAAALTVAIVLRLDYVSGEYEHAITTGNAPLREAALRRFGWIELIGRVRFLIVLLFWLAAGGQALLYFNSLKCWFDPPANLARDAQWLYGDKMPHPRCVTDAR